MAIGTSGRIVIELDPELKQAIHEAVKRRGLTLREWFIEQATKDLLEPQGSITNEKPTRSASDS